MPLDIQFIRCVFCGTNSLNIYCKTPICTKCNHEFADFEGIKFLGHYRACDILGLLEIISKISPSFDPEKSRNSFELEEEKLRLAFRDKYINHPPNTHVKSLIPGSKEMAQAVRLREWGSFELLSQKFDFNNKLCLDLGAGFGSDSLRLVTRGAHVVCVDYNPISLKSGSLIVPEAQWLGGNSECLPFVSNTFDFTVANAALHHMDKQRESVKEMCRVTKPGGYVFLISDPFTHNANTGRDLELKELQVFDNHPMVMNGVNEGLIPLNHYFEIIKSIDLRPTVLTMKIHDEIEPDNMPSYWQINQKTEECLGSKSGNISSVLKISDRKFRIPIVGAEEIPAKLLFETIGNPSKSIYFLLSYLQTAFFDSFPFKQSSKFSLMNGWHTKQDFDTNWRKGYNRVRLFCSKSYLSTVKEILIKNAIEDSQYKTDMYFSVNGRRICQFVLCGDSDSKILFNYKELCLVERNVLELGVANKDENKGAIWAPYDPDKSFLVSVTLKAWILRCFVNLKGKAGAV